jgi:hypothetical protein
VIISAASVHFPNMLKPWGALVLAINAGLWAGGVIAVAGSPLDLLRALPFALVIALVAALAGKRAPITLKVLSSWLIAVAMLAVTLQVLPVTPGYLPDHME